MYSYSNAMFAPCQAFFQFFGENAKIQGSPGGFYVEGLGLLFYLRCCWAQMASAAPARRIRPKTNCGLFSDSSNTT